MKQTVRILLMMLLALAFATTAFAQDSIGVGDSIDGEADDETVDYEIELEEDQTVEITLESDDFDTVVEVYNEDGDLVGENDDGFDSGFNSFLEFTAEEDGTYTIRIEAFGGDPDGDFELTVEEVMDEDEDDEDMDDEDSDDEDMGDFDLAYGDEEEFDVDGEDELELTFAGEEGDVVTIIARSEANDEQDLLLVLNDPDGDELAIFDSFGTAVLIRVELPDDGLYTIVIEERNGEELDDEVEVELIETEVLDLGDGPQTVELGDNFQVDRMVFEAEEDVRYFIFIEADDTIDGTLYIDFLEEDAFFAETRLSLSGTDGGVIIFEANDDGLVTVELDFFSFDGDNEFTIEIDEE